MPARLLPRNGRPARALAPSRRPLRRGAGRPAGAAGAQLRERILVAASAEFARLGLGGARVERIAAQAGANVGMLYYYFSSKDALFLAVLERAYAAIRDAEKALELDRGEPVDAMRRLVSFTWRFQLAHPEFITLVNSENLHQARHLKRSPTVADMHSPLVAAIERLLERGVRAGAFRDGVDPVQLYITIASLGYFYLSNRHTLSVIFRRDLLAAGQRAARLAHMEDVVIGYLRPER